MTGHLAACVASLLFAQPGREFEFDFRGKRFDPALFRTDRDAEPFVQPDDRGLRITLPGKTGPKAATGIELLSKLSGDFEASVGYELLELEAGTRATPGPGLQIYLRLDNAPEGVARNKGDGLVIVRCANTPWGNCVAFARMKTDPTGKRSQKDLSRLGVQANQSKGRLRVARVGENVTVAHGEGVDGAFATVGTLQVGTEDVSVFRVGSEPAGMVGGGPYRVDLLITNIRLKGPAAASVAAQSGTAAIEGSPSTNPRRGKLLALILACCLSALAVGAFWLRRRNNRAPARSTN